MRRTTPGEMLRVLDEAEDDESCDDVDKEDAMRTSNAYTQNAYGEGLLDQILSNQGDPYDDGPLSHHTVRLIDEIYYIT